MNADLQLPSPAGVGAIAVATATFAPGVIYAFFDAYFSPEPHWKFGRDGIFQLNVYIHLWLTICNLAAFLITIPLYYRWRLIRTKRRIIVHSMMGAILASASFYFGITAKLGRFLPHGTLSNDGVAEIIALTAATAILPFFLVMVLHLISVRLRPPAPSDEPQR